jgi:hypothetical protein
MKVKDLFEVEESDIKKILMQIRDNPDNARPWKAAMDLALTGDPSPELQAIIKSAVHSGFVDEFADFMAAADDKLFKKYSYLLTDKVRERFKTHNASLKLKKFERTPDEKKADKTHDTFIFVGVDKYEKMPDGKYERQLDIENLLKIDKYSPADLQMVPMMRMRAHTREGGHVYIIRLPAGFIKEKSTHRLEPWLIKLIDEHKQKI